jgi:hypothetical protein
MIQFRSVSELARTLGGVPAEMAAELRAELPRIGELLKSRSEANASWSDRIPGAHYLKVGLGSTTGGVTVGVDQTLAPHARPYEGLSSGGSRGFFRHPVYGDPDISWVSQDTRPFIAPAVEETRPEMQAAIEALVHKVTGL